MDCRWDADRAAPWPLAKGTVDPSPSVSSLHLEVRVAGHVDELRLRRALDQVLGARPADHEVVRVIDCSTDLDVARARTQLHAVPVRVSDWPPFRAWLTHHPDGDVVMLVANHAACDGPAALEILDAIADAYSRGAASVPLPDFLASRELPVRPADPPVARWLVRGQSALEQLRDLLARHTQVEADHARDDPGYDFHLMCLSPADTSRIIHDQRPGRSRNALLAGLHLAVDDWNLRHGTRARRTAVLATVNLRPPEWRAETVGNFSITARVSTGRRHRRSPPSALAAVTAQTTRNKRTRSGIALIAGLDRSGLLSLWAKQSAIVLQPLTRNRLIDTGILANLGVLQRPPGFGPTVGDGVDIWYSAPSRAPHALSVGVVTVAGRLHLVLRYPLRLFDAAAARRFAEGYVEQLLIVADGIPPSR